jgi:phosphoenolpyruvate carboxylase
MHLLLLNALKPTLVFVILKLVRTTKRTPYFTITKINWLMPFKEIIACSQNGASSYASVQITAQNIKEVLHVMTHTSAPFVSVLSTADERQHDFWL